MLGLALNVTMSIQLASLPRLSLQHLDRLPDCPAIYFAIDAKDRVLYIGQAKNLANRWRGNGHHRIEQLKQIHRRNQVTLAWLNCVNHSECLNELENRYIEELQPLLNGTEVPATKVIPAEVVLQQSLEKIAKYVVIFGIIYPPAEEKTIVILKYLGWRREIYNLRRIFQGISRKPTSLRWVEFIRRKNGPWWRTKCNGINLELGPWFEPIHPIEGLKYPVTDVISKGENPHPLAGIPLSTLHPKALQELLQNNSGFANKYPKILPYQTDPVKLIWRNFSGKDEQ